ncbi:MAG: efflux RND transporter periplasmic adaptor subunit [Bacteroidales bacterium]|nr:MAG: efflux RND transporter periplasmic adaptor subunit [Bacteroidales bacterium]
MKRISVIMLGVALMVGCTSTETPEAIKLQISGLKDKALEINNQIKELENKLAKMDDDNHVNGLVPVHVKNIQEESFEHYFLANAKVEMAEEALIRPEGSGHIKKIHVTKGQRVAKGDLIVSLNTSILENSIAEVKLGLDLATKVFDKQKALWEQNIGSEIQYLEAKNNKERLEYSLKTLQAQLDMSLVKAPFSGIVDDIYSKEGELASTSAPLVYLVNLDKLKIEADVTENILTKIHVGDMVTIKFPTYSDIVLNAPIKRIGNAIDQKTRTIKVEIWLDNVRGQIKPNQIAMLSIKDFESKNALVVPSIVLKQDSKGTFLFVASKNEAGKTVATKTYVETSLSYNDRTMVTKGLDKGQQVITAGFNQIGNGSLIEVRN